MKPRHKIDFNILLRRFMILFTGVVAVVVLVACASNGVPAPASAPAPVPTPIPQPTGFTVSNLRIPTLDESSAKGVEIHVTVMNNGAGEGTYTAELEFDGIVVQTQNVTLAGGASRDVTFAIDIIKSGSHVVTIGPLTGKLVWPGWN